MSLILLDSHRVAGSIEIPTGQSRQNIFALENTAAATGQSIYQLDFSSGLTRQEIVALESAAADVVQRLFEIAQTIGLTRQEITAIESAGAGLEMQLYEFLAISAPTRQEVKIMLLRREIILGMTSLVRAVRITNPLQLVFTGQTSTTKLFTGSSRFDLTEN